MRIQVERTFNSITFQSHPMWRKVFRFFECVWLIQTRTQRTNKRTNKQTNKQKKPRYTIDKCDTHSAMNLPKARDRRSFTFRLLYHIVDFVSRDLIVLLKICRFIGVVLLRDEWVCARKSTSIFILISVLGRASEEARARSRSRSRSLANYFAFISMWDIFFSAPFVREKKNRQTPTTAAAVKIVQICFH